MRRSFTTPDWIAQLGIEVRDNLMGHTHIEKPVRVMHKKTAGPRLQEDLS